MKAIIPTGGRGTRMQPLTFSINKHFIPIAGKPLIYYPIETIAESGIKEVLITYNPGWLKAVKDLLGTGKKWGLKLTYVLQEKPLGLANIVQVCEKDLKGEPFVFHLGDNMFTGGIKKQVEYFLKEKPDGMVTMVKHKDNSRLGVPVFNSKGRLINYLEKPKNPPNEFAVPGLYFFNNNVFKSFSGKDKIKPSPRGEYEIVSPFLWLIKHGYRVDVKEYKEKWLDPGKFDDWISTNKFMLKKNGDKNVVGKKVVKIKSQIIAPSFIGNNVRIENSIIGPFASISDGCVIKNTKIQNSITMERVKLENIGKTIDESLIGPDSEINNGHKKSKSLNLFIGEKSRINL